ncbi:PAS domain S-box protein [Hyalangium rubrum]|uniref:histidine kinase n=1 Tax=Hyalangium rubrum TaxID=3103134 RepID=A0ABU5H9V7_9BACT|nr:PAS domain S-box protein [Hyalangium sp. s54d21]MDY7230026.1 PAS domain S-box protein [Hyalangium sp. s54d21]
MSASRHFVARVRTSGVPSVEEDSQGLIPALPLLPRVPLRLADFLRSHREAILEAWEAEARELPAARSLSRKELRNHLPVLLDSIAQMMTRAPPVEVASGLGSVPDVHALERLGEGFDLREVVLEYRLLRRCVLRLWQAQGVMDTLEAATLFHEAVDEAVAATVSHYTRARERTFQALDRISAAAIGSPDLHTFLPRLLQVLRETVPVVDAVVVLLRDGDFLREESSVGITLEEGFRLRIGEGFAGEVASTRQPLTSRDASNDPRVRSHALRQSGLRALYGVPLLLGDELLGVVHMGSRTSHEFSDEDRLLLRTLAARTTSMVARTQAFDREQMARAEAQAALAQVSASEERLRRWMEVFTHLGVGVALVRSTDDVLEDVNPAFARMHGYTREELVGRSLADTLAPESRGTLVRHAAAAQSKPHHEYEAMHLRKDGSRFPALTHVTVFRDEAGRVVQRVGTVLDITQRRTAEAERQRLLSGIEAERARLAAVLDQLPAGVLLAEAPSGRLVMASRRVEVILGMSIIPVEHINEYVAYPVYHPDGRRLSVEEFAMARALAGEVVQGQEFEVRRPDGTRVSVLSSSSPIRDREGRITAAVVTFVDVSELRRAETAARQAAEFGEKLIGIVSHDLRNPLNAIHLSVTQLLHSESLPAREQRITTRIAKSTDRMKRMIAELLDFTRGRLGGGIPIQRVQGDLRGVVRQGVEELEAAWPERTVRLSVAPGQYEGTWDADRLVQVVSNLGGNALQYSPPDSPVSFSLSDGGEEVVLEVHNQGAPIPPEALPTLFDPFRRASSGGGGLGLGLYIVEQVVKGHGGRIEVRSTAEEGTLFRVLLPRQSAPKAG